MILVPVLATRLCGRCWWRGGASPLRGWWASQLGLKGKPEISKIVAGFRIFLIEST
jgi:hypothetical protein